LDFVQNDFEMFEDAFKDIFCDAVFLPEVCPPCVFVRAFDHVVCGTRQRFFDLTRHIGQTDSIAFGGFSPIDFGADTVFCGEGHRKKGPHDNLKDNSGTVIQSCDDDGMT